MKRDLVGQLRKEGYRLTGIRKGIIGIFEACRRPLTVMELDAMLAEKKMHADKVTLYRCIDFLKEKGLVTEVDFGDGKKHYESASRGHHHHLVCVVCGKVDDITLLHDLEDEEENIAKEKGFRVLRHSLEFFGKCKNCIN